MHLNLYHFPICWFIFSKISFVVIHLNSARVNACTQIDKPPNNVRSKEKWIRSTTTSSPKIVPFLALVHAKRRGIPAPSLERGKCHVHLLSFFLFPNATSNGPRPPVLWCPVFRLSVFVRLTSAFFPLLRHDTRLCRRKTIMYRHNKLFLPSSSCKPSFPGPPRLDLFSAFHFLCIANGKRKRGEERFLTKKRRRWTKEWRKDRGEIVVRRKLNDGITLTIIYDFLSAVDFLLWNFEEIKRQRFSVRWLPGGMSLE